MPNAMFWYVAHLPHEVVLSPTSGWPSVRHSKCVAEGYEMRAGPPPSWNLADEGIFFI